MLLCVLSRRDYQFDTVVLLNLILFKAADSSREIYEVAMQLLQVRKVSSFSSKSERIGPESSPFYGCVMVEDCVFVIM